MAKQSETGEALCPDGTALGWVRWPGTGRSILLIHGTFSTSSSCARLGAFLSDQGYDVWSFDWRGRGSSAVPDTAFTFDDVAAQDVATMVDLVRRNGAGGRLHLVGHSGGGLVALIWAALNPDRSAERVASFTLIASQATEAAQASGHRAQIERMRDWLQTQRGPFVPAGSTGVGDAAESVDLMLQWCDWNLSRRFVSVNGRDYAAALADLRVPTCAISAEGDRFVAPKAGCARMLSFVGATQKRHIHCGRETGYSEDFDHARLVTSSAAATEIWPQIIGWLEHVE